MSSHTKIMAELRKDREIRDLSREIRKLHTAELKAKLRELNASTMGSKFVRQDRLLRAVLWWTGYQDQVPWYNWDDAEEMSCESKETFLPKRTSRRSDKQNYERDVRVVEAKKKKIHRQKTAKKQSPKLRSRKLSRRRHSSSRSSSSSSSHSSSSASSSSASFRQNRGKGNAGTL